MDLIKAFIGFGGYEANCDFKGLANFSEIVLLISLSAHNTFKRVKILDCFSIKFLFSDSARLKMKESKSAAC